MPIYSLKSRVALIAFIVAEDIATRHMRDVASNRIAKAWPACWILHAHLELLPVTGNPAGPIEERRGYDIPFSQRSEV